MVPIEHGTPRGYGQHQRTRTVPCTPCLVEHRRAVMASRIRANRIGSVQVPLAVLEAALGGDPEALARFLGPDVVTAIEQWGDTHSVRPEVVSAVDATLRKPA